jgi:hypothetical protein
VVFQQAIWDFGPHRLRKRQYVVEKKPRWSSVSLLQLELHCTHTYEAYMSLTDEKEERNDRINELMTMDKCSVED